jgi:hypothetical protein
MLPQLQGRGGGAVCCCKELLSLVLRNTEVYEESFIDISGALSIPCDVELIDPSATSRSNCNDAPVCVCVCVCVCQLGMRGWEGGVVAQTRMCQLNISWCLF